jgi:pimeloyl-ACP methyl ester carboxylesterase
VVPLDRTGVVPGELTLRYRVRPARGARRGVLLLLAGGPGEAATPLREMRSLLGASLPRYDLVMLDTRGTGETALDCPALRRGRLFALRSPPKLTAAAARCARELGTRRRFFGVRAVADDIEAVRQALGVRRLVVGGVSYGTLQAQAYAHIYPGSVHGLVLDSVVDPAAADGLDFTSLQATGRVLRELCAGRCDWARSDLVADVARLQRRLERAPLRGAVTLPSGRRSARTLGGPRRLDDLLGVLVAGDFGTELRAAFPAAVRSALAGDPRALLRLSVYGDPPTIEPPRVFSDALFVAALCSDARPPWPRGSSARERALALSAAIARRRVPAPWTAAVARVSGFGHLCVGWPEDADPVPAALPDVPALVLAGRQDLRTTLSEARSVAARLPRARLVAVPDVGHSVLAQSACARLELSLFLGPRSRSAGLLSPACLRRERRGMVVPPPLPRRLAGVRDPHGRGLAGRVATAAWLTVVASVRDAYALSLARRGRFVVGGLEGGRVLVSPGTAAFEFRAFSEIPGVVVDGRLSPDGTGALRIRGRARGRLEIAPGYRTTATVHGVTVDLPDDPVGVGFG